jgi:hypothetical protein
MNRRGNFDHVSTATDPCANFVIGSIGFFRYNEAFDLSGREKMIS